MASQKLSWRERYSFTHQYWITEDRKWVRTLNAICMSAFCIYAASTVIYLLSFSGTVSNPPFMKLLLMLAGGYLIAAIPIGLMFYRETNLRKYERIFLSFFIMLSCICLLLSVFPSLHA